MVAILWANGYNGATVRLNLCGMNLLKKKLDYFIAYPKSGLKVLMMRG